MQRSGGHEDGKQMIRWRLCVRAWWMGRGGRLKGKGAAATLLDGRQSVTPPVAGFDHDRLHITHTIQAWLSAHRCTPCGVHTSSLRVESVVASRMGGAASRDATGSLRPAARAVRGLSPEARMVSSRPHIHMQHSCPPPSTPSPSHPPPFSPLCPCGCVGRVVWATGDASAWLVVALGGACKAARRARTPANIQTEKRRTYHYCTQQQQRQHMTQICNASTLVNICLKADQAQDQNEMNCCCRRKHDE